jgi:hypothetical protein
MLENWDKEKSYVVGDKVVFAGKLCVATQPNTNTLPFIKANKGNEFNSIDQTSLENSLIASSGSKRNAGEWVLVL